MTREPAIAVMAVVLATSPVAAGSCQFLMPIGGDGSTTVTKRVERPKLSPLSMALGRTNWNTDFAVTKPYRSYGLFFKSNPQSRPATRSRPTSSSLMAVIFRW